MIGGAGGFIGGALARYFQDKGFHRIRAIDTMIKEKLNWEPSTPLKDGLAKTYAWIEKQYQDRKAGKRTVS